MDAYSFVFEDLGLFAVRILALSCWIIFSVGIPLVIWFLISLPMRRSERTQLILDLLERGLRSGRTPEQVILELADCRDRSLGKRLYRMAGLVRQGIRFDQALERTPGFLPPQILAILRAGCALGDISKVLPAARRCLADSASQTRASLNFLPILSLVLLPVLPFVLTVLHIWVEPKFWTIWSDMDAGMHPSTGVQASLYRFPLLIGTPLMMMGLFYLGVILYLAGPWLQRTFQKAGIPVLDWMACSIPWQWKRLQRDFSTLLALLLDSGVPERDAIRIAGEGTANVCFQRRTQRMLETLKQGHPLPSALRILDRSGEFEWRLSNAARSSHGFMSALRGWLEFLDAKAFQQQQTAAQLLSTAVVLINGVVVGFITFAVFQFLLGILSSEALW